VVDVSRTYRPRRLPAAFSLLAGVVAVLLVANQPGQHTAVFVETVGLAVCIAGLGWRSRSPALGIVVAVLGLLVALASFAMPLAGFGGPGPILVAAAGMFGLLALALGLGPVRRGWERGFLAVGASGTLLAVLLDSLLRGAGTTTLLFAGIASLVAWDAGEQAVNLGEQVENEASALTAELVHPGATLAVGGVGIAVALGVGALGVTGLSLPVLLVLLVAGLLTTAALFH